jgi:hypothetical protein
MHSMLPEGSLASTYLAEEPYVQVFGVAYVHLREVDGSDLYLMDYSLPFADCLLPENHWADNEWARSHRTRLPGTSTLYRMETKPVEGKSKRIVLKWNRMGQDIPGATQAADLETASFNSPFEEFALVVELRKANARAGGGAHTHRPLAIYVPRQRVEPERLGRRPYKLAKLQETHTEVALDPNRNYAVIYEWVKGIDAAEALRRDVLDEGAVQRLLSRSQHDLSALGFRVRDNKPHHLIVRPRGDHRVALDRSGRPLYALVDFELLERTPARESKHRAARRHAYLAGQAHRFDGRPRPEAGVTPVRVMGVDYVFGHVESTGGALWVVGKDTDLFDFFLPEKWRRQPRTGLSDAGKVYETRTADDIHLVWRVSRVGAGRPLDHSGLAGGKGEACGYNSPFEEFSLNMCLSQRGVDVVYPRAIYMTGHKSEGVGPPVDDSRYESHALLVMPDGHPILSEYHDYITLWGYWNGPDEMLAEHDEDYYTSIDASRAVESGHISEESCVRIIESAERRLREAGVQALDLRGDHLLLSLDHSCKLLLGPDGLPVARLCSFDLLRPTDEGCPDGRSGLAPT